MSKQATCVEHVYLEYQCSYYIEPIYQREEIVRCRDCIYYTEDPEPIDPGWPMMCEESGRDMLGPDGFCAWAERRNE